MATSVAKARSLAARTVHIKISPTPQNLSESRVVLQELEQKFGEVTMFRSLKVCLKSQSSSASSNVRVPVPSYSPSSKRRHSNLPLRKRSPNSPRESQPPIRPDNRARSTRYFFRWPSNPSTRIGIRTGRNSNRQRSGRKARSEGIPTRFLSLGFRARAVYKVTSYEPALWSFQTCSASTFVYRCGTEANGAAITLGYGTEGLGDGCGAEDEGRCWVGGGFEWKRE